MRYSSEEEYKPELRFLACPFCGKKEYLLIRKTSKPADQYGNYIYGFSIRCVACDMVYGEDSEQVQRYSSESDLLADWNRRRYR